MPYLVGHQALSAAMMLHGKGGSGLEDDKAESS